MIYAYSSNLIGICTMLFCVGLLAIPKGWDWNDRRLMNKSLESIDYIDSEEEIDDPMLEVPAVWEDIGA